MAQHRRASASRRRSPAQYLTKGKKVFVEGRIQTRSWDDKESGKKQYKTEIICDNFQMLGSRATAAAAGARRRRCRLERSGGRRRATPARDFRGRRHSVLARLAAAGRRRATSAARRRAGAHARRALATGGAVAVSGRAAAQALEAALRLFQPRPRGGRDSARRRSPAPLRSGGRRADRRSRPRAPAPPSSGSDPKSAERAHLEVVAEQRRRGSPDFLRSRSVADRRAETSPASRSSPQPG